MQIDICPYATRARMFSGVDRSCEEARRKFRTSYQDPYKLRVELFALDELEYFNEALEMVLRFDPHRRFLNLMELLSYNMSNRAIRSMYPVFTDTFTLDYEPATTIHDPDDNDNVWAMRPSWIYKGQVVNAGVVFATAPFTPLEEVSIRDMGAISKILVPDGAVSKPKSEVPRLTA